MISHDNITWTARVGMEHTKWRPGQEVCLTYLPLSHIAAQMLDCYMSMYVGATVYFADKRALQGTLVSFQY